MIRTIIRRLRQKRDAELALHRRAVRVANRKPEAVARFLAVHAALAKGERK